MQGLLKGFIQPQFYRQAQVTKQHTSPGPRAVIGMFCGFVAYIRPLMVWEFEPLLPATKN